MKCSTYLLARVAFTYACQHDIHHVDAFFGIEDRLVKRQEPVNFPPALEPDEAVLLNAIESTDLDEWSYYYTHQPHLAGTNEGLAQWTADRWAENGFESSLVEYGKFPRFEKASVALAIEGKNETSALIKYSGQQRHSSISPSQRVWR